MRFRRLTAVAAVVAAAVTVITYLPSQALAAAEPSAPRASHALPASPASPASPGSHRATVVRSSVIDAKLRASHIPVGEHVTKAASGPITVNLSIEASGAFSVYADATQSTDAAESTSITGISYAFGDGSAAVAGGTGAGVEYQYAKLGTYTITVTVSDSAGNVATATSSFSTAGSELTPYGPVRILDTRKGTGTNGTIAKVGSDSALKLKIAGAGLSGNTIPTTVTAVALNVTVTDATAAGSITAYPDGASVPSAQYLDYSEGSTLPNPVIVPVGSDGYIDLYNTSTGSVDLVGDVSGYFTGTTASEYQPISPYRLVDTRVGTGTNGVVAKVAAGATLVATVAGADGGTLPAKGISAVAVNLIAVDAAGGGLLTAYPDGASLPVASNVNYGATSAFANAALVPVGADGKIDINNNSGGTVDVVIDVFGYFSASITKASAFIPTGPTRILDTRQSYYPINGPLAQDTLYQLPTLSAGMGITGVVLSATILDEAAGGYIKFYPYNTGLQSEVPITSNADFAAGVTQTRLSIDTLGTTVDDEGLEDLGIENVSAGTIDLVLDMTGIFDSE